MQKAEYVISRSGYSTVMDIATLGKKSIFIPTPGQTEQEYLAQYLSEKKIAFSISQKDFELQDTLEKASIFIYSRIDCLNHSKLTAAISSLLSKLPTAVPL